MMAFGHVACDRNVVGLIRENEPGNFPLAHDTAQRFRISRVTACEPMCSQLKDIADLRDRPCQQIRFEGALLKPVSVAQNNLVDLIEGEARDLNRSVG
jgi:hypothetical protein